MTFFESYTEGIIYWAPLLAYAFVRGHSFVEVTMPNCSVTVMPVPPDDRAVWQRYDFDSFAEDGLSVVGRSKDTVAERVV